MTHAVDSKLPLGGNELIIFTLSDSSGETAEAVARAALVQFPPDWMGVVKVAVVFVIGQALEGNVLSPKLVGDRVGLHPVWIMFALLAGGALFGFVGVLIAVPVAAVIGVLVRHLIGRYRDSQYYRGGAAG